MKKKQILAAVCVSTALLGTFASMQTLNGQPSNVDAAMVSEFTTTTDVTINGVENGAKIKVYKVADVDIEVYHDGTFGVKTPQYYWESALRDTVKSIKSSYIGDKGEVQSTFEASLSDDGELKAGTVLPESKGAAEFYDKLAASISKTKSVTPTSLSIVQADNTAKFSLNPAQHGVYLIVIDGGNKVYRPLVLNYVPTVSGDTMKFSETMSLAAKSSELPLDKVVKEKSTANTGLLHYTVTQKTPVYPANAINKKFVIKDTLPDGVKFKADSLVIKNQDGSVTLTKDIDYSVATSKDGSKDVFTITFKPAVFEKNATSVVLTYNGEFDVENASTYKSLTNNVTTTYTVTPYDSSDEVDRPVDDSTTTYTYGINLTKTGESSVKLAKAGFQILKDGQPLNFINNGDGTYTFTTDESADNLVDVVTTPESGILNIYGLDLGKYTVKEVKAPEGYTLANPVELSIVDSDNDGNVDNDTDNTANITIQDVKAFDLPTTGAKGVALLVVAGALFIGMGGYFYKVGDHKKLV